jgi:hypothetical protein
MSDIDLKLIVIAGCQRSGTTLIGQILGAHPNTFLIDETEGVYDWYYALIRKNPNTQLNLDKTVRQAAQKYRDHRAVYRTMADLSNSAIVLKAPNLTYEFEQLSELCPRPFIVYPVRNAVAVVASMKALSKVPIIKNQVRLLGSNEKLASRFAKELRILCKEEVPEHIKFALIWKIKTGLYHDFESAGLYPHSVTYESLIRDPSTACMGLAEKCEITWEESMLSYGKVMNGMGPGNTPRNRNIDHSSIHKWKNVLSDSEIEDIRRIAEQGL